MTRMTKLTSILLLCAGCGGGTQVDGGREDAGTPLDSGFAADAGGTDSGFAADSGGIDSGFAADAGGTDSGFAADAGPSDAGPSDAGAPVVTLTEVGVYANCMPAVPPDPILAFWTADVTGATGPMATLVDAKLTVSGSPSLTQTLTVSPVSFVLSSGAGAQMQRKTGADSTPVAACATYCGGGATYSLELTYQIGGHTVPVVSSGSFGCVY